MKFDVRTFTIGGGNLTIICDYSDHKFVLTYLEMKIAHKKLGEAIKKIDERNKIREELDR